MGLIHIDQFVTVDGVAQAPGKPDEDDRGRIRVRRLAGTTLR